MARPSPGIDCTTQLIARSHFALLTEPNHLHSRKKNGTPLPSRKSVPVFKILVFFWQAGGQLTIPFYRLVGLPATQDIGSAIFPPKGYPSQNLSSVESYRRFQFASAFEDRIRRAIRPPLRKY
jgi:hypothetical protein